VTVSACERRSVVVPDRNVGPDPTCQTAGNCCHHRLVLTSVRIGKLAVEIEGDPNGNTRSQAVALCAGPSRSHSGSLSFGFARNLELSYSSRSARLGLAVGTESAQGAIHLQCCCYIKSGPSLVISSRYAISLLETWLVTRSHEVRRRSAPMHRPGDRRPRPAARGPGRPRAPPPRAVAIDDPPTRRGTRCALKRCSSTRAAWPAPLGSHCANPRRCRGEHRRHGNHASPPRRRDLRT